MKEKAALQWIKKTREEWKEVEREEKIRFIFEIEFGFKPEVVEWKNNEGERVLVAKAKVKELDEQIMGEKVAEVIFLIEEDPWIIYNEEWSFSSVVRAGQKYHKWRRLLKGYRAIVEIMTK